MSDIVERLRKDTMHWYDEGLAHEAAAEINRLREALKLIAIVEQGCGGNLSFKEMAESAMRQARAALAREAGQ